MIRLAFTSICHFRGQAILHKQARCLQILEKLCKLRPKPNQQRVENSPSFSSSLLGNN